MGQISYVFRRQRIGGATEWYLGARNYPLRSKVVFGAGGHKVMGVVQNRL